MPTAGLPGVFKHAVVAHGEAVAVVAVAVVAAVQSVGVVAAVLVCYLSRLR